MKALFTLFTVFMLFIGCSDQQLAPAQPTFVKNCGEAIRVTHLEESWCTVIETDGDIFVIGGLASVPKKENIILNDSHTYQGNFINWESDKDRKYLR